MEKNNKTKLTESVMGEVMSIEEAKRLTIESVRKIYEENGCINFEKFDLLNESEQLNEQSTWNDQQWWQFFSRGETLTHEEFCLKLDKIIQDVYGD